MVRVPNRVHARVRSRVRVMLNHLPMALQLPCTGSPICVEVVMELITDDRLARFGSVELVKKVKQFKPGVKVRRCKFAGWRMDTHIRPYCLVSMGEKGGMCHGSELVRPIL